MRSGKTADIVVRLDGDAWALERDRFDDVGIERALGEKVGTAEFTGLALENIDERSADDLPLLLGIVDLAQPGQEQFGGIDRGQRDVEMAAEQLDDLLDLARPEQGRCPPGHRSAARRWLRAGGGRSRRNRRHPKGRRSRDPRRPARAPAGPRWHETPPWSSHRCSRRSAARSSPAAHDRAAYAPPPDGTARHRHGARRRRSRRKASHRRSPRRGTRSAARRSCRHGSSRPVHAHPGSKMPSNKAQRSTTSRKARPNSRWWPISTLPPSWAQSICSP